MQLCMKPKAIAFQLLLLILWLMTSPIAAQWQNTDPVYDIPYEDETPTLPAKFLILEHKVRQAYTRARDQYNKNFAKNWNRKTTQHESDQIVADRAGMLVGRWQAWNDIWDKWTLDLEVDASKVGAGNVRFKNIETMKEGKQALRVLKGLREYAQETVQYVEEVELRLKMREFVTRLMQLERAVEALEKY